MKLLVFGASGGTGQQIVLQALAAGHEVTAVVRNPDRVMMRDERLRVVKGNALDPASCAAVLPGHDAVLSALGVTGFLRSLQPMTFYHDAAVSITRAMRERAIPRLVAITSVGVLRDPTTPIWYRALVRPLLRHKYADMRRMEDVVRGSGLVFTIIRPVRLVDGPLTRRYRIGEDGNLPNGGTISRADLADAMIRHIDDVRFYNRAIAVSY